MWLFEPLICSSGVEYTTGHGKSQSRVMNRLAEQAAIGLQGKVGV